MFTDKANVSYAKFHVQFLVFPGGTGHICPQLLLHPATSAQKSEHKIYYGIESQKWLDGLHHLVPEEALVGTKQSPLWSLT